MSFPKSKISFIMLLLPFMLLSLKCGSKGNTGINVPSAVSLISEQQFNALFPMRDKFYTYAAFMRAVKELGAINIRVAKRAAGHFWQSDHRRLGS